MMAVRMYAPSPFDSSDGCLSDQRCLDTHTGYLRIHVAIYGSTFGFRRISRLYDANRLLHPTLGQRPGGGRLPALVPLLQWQHFVHDAVVAGLLRAEEEVALGVALDALQRLAGVRGNDVVDDLARVQQLAGVDVNIRHLAAKPALDQGLVQVDTRVRQGIAPAGVARHQQDGAEAGRLANAGGGDGAANRAHRVVDRQP